MGKIIRTLPVQKMHKIWNTLDVNRVFQTMFKMKMF